MAMHSTQTAVLHSTAVLYFAVREVCKAAAFIAFMTYYLRYRSSHSCSTHSFGFEEEADSDAAAGGAWIEPLGSASFHVS